MMAYIITPLISVLFLGLVLLLWTGAQLLAEKRLGVRKQGCKGPVPGKNGELLCCKGDGRLCDEMDRKQAR